MNKIVVSLGLTALLLMAGCAKQFVKVDPSTQQFGPVSFTTTQPWNKVEINADHSIWTVDGITLNTLELTGNVGKGERLFGSAETIKGPQFEPSMSLPEQSEFLLASLRADGLPNAEIFGLEAFRIGEIEAFTVYYGGENEDGLDTLGLAVGFVHDGAFHAIIYRAASEHYYEKLLPEVTGIIESLKSNVVST